MRLEAYVAAAGGILLIAFTGPLASYSYVLQYLLIGEAQRMCPTAAPEASSCHTQSAVFGSRLLVLVRFVYLDQAATLLLPLL